MPLAIPQNYRWVLVSGRRHEAVPPFLKVYPKLRHIWVHNRYFTVHAGLQLQQKQPGAQRKCGCCLSGINYCSSAAVSESLHIQSVQGFTLPGTLDQIGRKE